MSKSQKALPTSKVVEFGNGETVTVEKLPLGKYSELLLVLRNLPKTLLEDLKDLDEHDEQESLQVMLGIFGESWGQVVDIIAIGSGVDRDRLENDSVIGLDGGMALFFAIFEVNNLSSVVSQGKNLMSRLVKK